MDNLKYIKVFFNGAPVGTIAQYDKIRTAFQYAPSWIESGFSISPLSLPLDNRVHIASAGPFDGMYGVFNDVLPDGWGRLVTDRYLASKKINPQSVSALSRLALINSDSIGALSFEPMLLDKDPAGTDYNIDDFYDEARRMLLCEYKEADLDSLFRYGSASNGARPKILIEMDGKSWLIKFPSIYDEDDMGQMEYDYHEAAIECGIQIPEIKLLPSTRCSGIFASKRFDRDKKGRRIHVVSVSGLLESHHSIPALDYRHIFKLSFLLSKDLDELMRIYDLMCFNVLSHNQDDHAKNFSFIFSEDDMKWRLSPAYDLTFSSTTWGEQSTTVNGKGRDITVEDAIKTALPFGLEEKKLREHYSAIAEIVHTKLGRYIRG